MDLAVRAVRAGWRAVLAAPGDGGELADILQAYDMDLAGRPEEHAVIRAQGKIVACGKLTRISPGLFHLDVLAARREERGRGWGGLLLSQLVAEPSVYCPGCGVGAGGGVDPYTITTVARGAASRFYARYGFKPDSFENLPGTYRNQCAICPDRTDCHPVPMTYLGGQLIAQGSNSVY